MILTVTSCSPLVSYNRFNIDKKDLRKQMNDTTNSALKAGRLIVGDDKSENVLCGMHVVELVVGHASGFLERTVGKVVVDENKPCLEFSKRVRKCVKEFSDRKTKSKMERYQDFCNNKIGLKPIKIPLPNKTRVAGNFRMYEGLLRSHYAVQRYCQYNTRPGYEVPGFKQELYLNRQDWQQLSEYCAIYEKTTTLVMELQSDNPASLSIAKLLLANCILELGGAAPTNETTPWDPFEVDDRNVLFEAVIVNDLTVLFCPSTPYSKLRHQSMCLPLKETPTVAAAAGVSLIVACCTIVYTSIDAHCDLLSSSLLLDAGSGSESRRSDLGRSR